MTDTTGDATDLIASIEEPLRFSQVFDRHFDTVHSYLARRVGRDGADELAAEVFCIAFERRHTFDPRLGDARPWLFGIARNLLQRRWRTGDRHDRAVDRLRERTLLVTSGTEISDPIEAQQLANALDEALDSLPADDRETLLLFAWERLTYDQIAESLGIPVGTVRSRISRARARVRSALTESGHPTTTPEGQMT